MPRAVHPPSNGHSRAPADGCASLGPRNARSTFIWISALIVCTATIWSAVVPPPPVLLWNASASSPKGLYLVTSALALRAGDMTVAWLPPAARRLAARRHYLPANVPLVKRVAAAAGDSVCAAGDRIRINGRLAAVRRRADPSRRPMPRWTGCKKLAPGQLFLLGAASPASFDGRYFGLTGPGALVGGARKLWPR
jgi:conjugative transfer signal peptidase TraF